MEEFEAETAEDERDYLFRRSLGNLPIRMSATLTDLEKGVTDGDVDEDENNQIEEETNIYFDYE